MEYQPGTDSVENSVWIENKLIIIVGATGHLGSRIIFQLLEKGARVRSLLRKGSDPAVVALLRQTGVEISELDFNNPKQLKEACRGGSCVVSALSGVGDVIIGVQRKLLEAACAAGVPRFIPSDFCIDYTKLPPGTNRNLDLRREFNRQLDKAPIAGTSILNGMFTNLLTGQAPVILFKMKKVLYWGDREQLLDFTTMENTATYTAVAALDEQTPRYLRIAGEVTNVNGLRRSASEVTRNEFRLFRAGSLGGLRTMIKITRALLPKKDEVFPPWQGMQYLHDMFTGLPKLSPLDNDRYPGIEWTSVREVLAGRGHSKEY